MLPRRRFNVVDERGAPCSATDFPRVGMSWIEEMRSVFNRRNGAFDYFKDIEMTRVMKTVAILREYRDAPAPLGQGSAFEIFLKWFWAVAVLELDSELFAEFYDSVS